MIVVMNIAKQRQRMVDEHLRARGIINPRLLQAMAEVPRESFVPSALTEFAYEDRPLPIPAGQTISQPYIVALMIEALRLSPDDDVLEIGTGSGYAAAVLSRIAHHVYTIERHAELADAARERLAALGYHNVDVRCGDGTLGWPEHAPYTAIIAAAAGPDAPQALLDQLAIGGRLVMPVGESRAQELIRVTRVSSREFHREELGGVRFVPLIGTHGWTDEPKEPVRRNPRVVPPPRAKGSRPAQLASLIAECAEPIDAAQLEQVPVDALLDRIGDARVVLLGECTHGTSEFYRMRSRITQELIRRRGFTAIAVEADWPDAAVVDRYVRHLPPTKRSWSPFSRFPTWMWRNREVSALIDWLQIHNAKNTSAMVSFSGLDLYSMYISASEVIRYLERIDHVAAQSARERYGRLTPWQADPSAYGRAALMGKMRSAEHEVVAMLRELLAKRLEYSSGDAQQRDDFFDASRNARVVADAERYYRAMYYGAVESWNLRDQHMFETLRSILAHRGTDAKLIVWEHNSHLGDASATEMAARGEHNVGQLCRMEFGDDVYAVGFGTDRGFVAAADQWDDPMKRMAVRPARADSYERLCHDANIPAFSLALRYPARDELVDELMSPRLERAIGVVYRPQTELQSHYFQAVLPRQFDEYIWFDETDAVTPLPVPDNPEPASHPLMALGQDY